MLEIREMRATPPTEAPITAPSGTRQWLLDLVVLNDSLGG